MRPHIRNSVVLRALTLSLVIWVATPLLAASPPRVMTLRMILVHTQEKASEALELLKKGETFRAVARRLSQGPTASRGGFLGAMRLDWMNPAFRKAAEALKPGAYGAPFRSGRDIVILYRMGNDFMYEGIALGKKADELMKNGDVAGAISLYLEAVDVYPEYIHGYSKLGVAYGEAGEFSKEADAYAKAIKIEPKYHEAYYNLGALLLSQGQFRRAIQSFQSALQINPDLVLCYVNMSAAYQALGERREAIDAARKALEINPIMPEAYYNLGSAYGDQDPKSALDNFDMAATLDPDNPKYRLSGAIALAHLGRVQESEQRLQVLLKTNPHFEKAERALEELRRTSAMNRDRENHATRSPGAQSAESLAEQARQSLRSGDIAKALELYERAVALKPTSREIQSQRAWTLVAMGRALMSEGRMENAIMQWKRALGAFPDFVPALQAMAQAAIIQGRFGAAQEYLKKGRKVEPDNPDLAILQSRLDYEQRDLESAFAELEGLKPARLSPSSRIRLLEQLLYLDLDEEALKLFRGMELPHPLAVEAVNHLIKFGHYEEAEKYLKSHPLPVGQALLGKLYSQQLRFKEAKAILGRLIREEPRAWSAYYFLGQVYTNMGEAEQAVEVLRKALALQPNNANILYQLGLAAAQAGQVEQAKGWLRQGLTMSPTSFQLNFEMGRLLLEDGDIRGAEPYLLKVLETEPDHIRTHYLLGRLYRQAGDSRKSHDYLSRFQALKKQLNQGRAALLAKQESLKGRTLFP